MCQVRSFSAFMTPERSLCKAELDTPWIIVRQRASCDLPARRYCGRIGSSHSGSLSALNRGSRRSLTGREHGLTGCVRVWRGARRVCVSGARWVCVRGARWVCA